MGEERERGDKRVSLTTVGFGIGLALVAVVAVLASRQLSSLDESERWVSHTHDVVEQSQALVIAVADAGRARRTFAQTRDEGQLGPYRAAHDRVTGSQRALRQLTADTAAQQALLDQIDGVLAARFDQLETSIRDARTHGFSSDSEVAPSNATVDVTGRLAQLVAQLDAREHELLDERSAAMHSQSESAKVTIVVGFAASMVILVAAFFVSQREVKRRMREIAERQRVEESARQANARLVSAVDSIDDAFAIYDEHDRIVMVNSTFRHSFGQSLEGPIVGRTFEEVLDAGLALNTYQLGTESPDGLRARRLAYHRNPSGTFELRTTDGRILRIFEHRTPEGGSVSLYVDVTLEIAREDELRIARAEADAASAAKSEFLSSMSHELRTPLNAILGFTQLLRGDRKLPLAQRHLDRLEPIERGGEHLLRLINDVLDLAKIEAGRVEIVNAPMELSDVVDEVIASLEPMAAQAQIKIMRPPPGTIGTGVVADRTRVSQILMNFGSNAIKYGRSGGHVTIDITPADDTVRITISDDGIGIPADKQARIFEPFHRAGQEAGPIQGTGIGLAICKRLAAAMLANIGFSSEAGRGSTFWIDLRAHRATTETERSSRPSSNFGDSPLTADGPHRRLVYIEDNPSNIALMEAMLEEYPRIEMLTAGTAETGIELVKKHHPHVVIMDINLPGMSGLEAARALAQLPETREIPIVALSAAALTRDTERAKGSGFRRYLTKPVKIDELTAVLEEILLPDERR